LSLRTFHWTAHQSYLCPFPAYKSAVAIGKGEKHIDQLIKNETPKFRRQGESAILIDQTRKTTLAHQQRLVKL